MKINFKKISLKSLYLRIIKRQETEIQGLLHPAQANLAIFSCVVSVPPAALNTV
jgi:hypothetical protein